MTKPYTHHMLFVEEVAFYSEITVLTPVQRSKVTARSKSYDTIGQRQWSSGSSMDAIRQSITKIERNVANHAKCHDNASESA